MIEFTLPTPLSWNRLYRFGMKRMYRTREYTSWMQRAVAWAMAQNVGSAEGYVAVEYIVPVNLKRDLDNHLKPLNDILETIGVIGDDRQIRHLTVKEAERDDVLVKIREIENAVQGRRGKGRKAAG